MAEELRMLKLQTLSEMVERAKTISRGKEISDQRKQELSFYAGYDSPHYGGKGKARGNYNVKGGKGGKGFKGSPGKGVILVDELVTLPGT
ncbi:hypothetical protein Pmar_PMAR007374 [Perkinsus marinus ATCC 50983]|uniref:Uncharacterized protein n=1 Tax=Perkinsus marinus (strain ATCC 50983 / TXsc) TaxID=423536 RepID=C5K659_PERM5|nr:hypothetical protein Pmar_PMAR007374 [Perkinsus marinus ATCC 50983]EER20089.1 hypothetical protein Pmar_PMAR007374 [Perkinsus marinus ATCC 50983]|eukprot:XP_002788293.1 hypothetical protein Pmar_PMAR007374 [Perkinsus marinus ATCC 50983]